MAAVQARKRLNGLHIGQDLIYIHGVQKRLVVAGLELVGHHEDAVRVVFHIFLNVFRGKSVDIGFGHFLAAIVLRA